MIRVVINGILGRMGREISNAILKDDDLILVGGIDNLETFYSDEIVVTTNPQEVLTDSNIVVDFSSGEGTVSIAKACREKKVSLITGTTGLSEEQQKVLLETSKVVPVIQSFNFSIGINLLVNILQKTAAILEGEFDTEIVDVHHRKKKDAPSGTALLLAETVANSLGIDPEKAIQKGRHGSDLTRGEEITIHSLRGGSVIGEHQVHLYCQHEVIKIFHQACSRQAFVNGLLRAIFWIPDQKPGFYTMQDVLDLK